MAASEHLDHGEAASMVDEWLGRVMRTSPAYAKLRSNEVVCAPKSTDHDVEK